MKAALDNGLKLIVCNGGDKQVSRGQHFHGLDDGLDVTFIVGILHGKATRLFQGKR